MPPYGGVNIETAYPSGETPDPSEPYRISRRHLGMPPYGVANKDSGFP